MYLENKKPVSPYRILQSCVYEIACFVEGGGPGKGGGGRLRRRGVRINFRRLSILSLCDVLNKGIRGFICIILHFIYSSLKIALFFLFK